VKTGGTPTFSEMVFPISSLEETEIPLLLRGKAPKRAYWASAPAVKCQLGTEVKTDIGSPCEILFQWEYEGNDVYVVGDFTDWGKHPLRLQKTTDRFHITVPLSPGVYEYKFIVDGKSEWFYDVSKPHILNVGSGYANNVVIIV